MRIDRRSFLQSLAALSAALALPGAATEDRAGAGRDRLGPLLPRRALGATGESVTLLGVGGSHVGEMPERDAQAAIELALAGGVRFFDTAHNYQAGESERRYGRFLVPKHRDLIFLMTKTMARSNAEARLHLEESLGRLRTDHLDLWQVHSVNSPQDVDRRIEAGVLDALIEAKRSGKARHIGFTGHRDPEAHARMLERTRSVETCQMPVNVLDPGYRSFTAGVMPELIRRRVGVIAMKTLANGGLLGAPNNVPSPMARAIPDRISLRDALHFVWSLPVSVLVTGANSPAQLKETIAIARSFVKMNDTARRALITRVADLAGRDVEYYKA